MVYYEYDAKHQLTRETQRDDQGQDLYAYEWDYDAAGNREYQVFNGTATYYEYNAANELLTEIRLRQGFGGQAGADTIYYHYDGCGNTTAKQEASGTTYYQWDHENLMTRIDFPDGGHNYFAYDADSKRVEKRDSSGYTRFTYQGPDMLRLLLERDGDGETKVHYTMGSGLEAMRRADGGDISAGDSSFYHYDWLGSTFELTDADQVVTDTYRYNAWGEVLGRTGTTDNPHTYVGNQRYYEAPDAALMLLGVRYYVAAAAQFLSVDPLPDASGVYTYADSRPTSWVDPHGRKSVMLTFDDGPNANSTEKILRTLDAYGITAGFFVTGMRAGAYPPGLWRITMSPQGHAIGNHTQNHPQPWCSLATTEMACEWYECHVTVRRVGHREMTLYRTPGLGSRRCPARTLDSIDRARLIIGMVGAYGAGETMGTTVDYRWDAATYAAVLRYFGGSADADDLRAWQRVRGHVMDGIGASGDPAILIMHDNASGLGTADILDHIIDAVINEPGHTIVDFHFP